MLAPSEVGWDLALYAQEWLEERFRLTLKLARDVAKKPSTRIVHDLRVACRRLREAISFFHGVTEVPPLSDVDRAARRMARAVRRLRETDVAIKRLRRLRVAGTTASGGAPTGVLSTSLDEKREQLAKKRKKRIGRRAKQLEAAIKEHLPLRVRPRAADVDPAKEAELRAFVEARVASRRAEVERLFDVVRARGPRVASDRDVDRLHGIRVAIKHWRYASEIARAVMPRVLYRPMAAKLRHLQDLGGKSQDFADLATVVEKELDGGGSREEKAILGAVRNERARASREFYDALKTLVFSSRGANGA
jgi:CHAD domain-containing protein